MLVSDTIIVQLAEKVAKAAFPTYSLLLRYRETVGRIEYRRRFTMDARVESGGLKREGPGAPACRIVVMVEGVGRKEEHVARACSYNIRSDPLRPFAGFDVDQLGMRMPARCSRHVRAGIALRISKTHAEPLMAYATRPKLVINLGKQFTRHDCIHPTLMPEREPSIEDLTRRLPGRTRRVYLELLTSYEASMRLGASSIYTDVAPKRACFFEGIRTPQAGTPL